MRRTFAKHPLRQRVIAIAFAGLIASFGAAQAVAGAADGGSGIICHSDVADQQAPASNQTDGKICADCCIGCIAALATIMPPTVAAAGPPQLSFKQLDRSMARRSNTACRI